MDLGLNSLSTDRLPRAVLARFNEVKGMLRVAVRGKVGSMGRACRVFREKTGARRRRHVEREKTHVERERERVPVAHSPESFPRTRRTCRAEKTIFIFCQELDSGIP